MYVPDFRLEFKHIAMFLKFKIAMEAIYDTLHLAHTKLVLRRALHYARAKWGHIDALVLRYG